MAEKVSQNRGHELFLNLTCKTNERSESVTAGSYITVSGLSTQDDTHPDVTGE